MKDVLLKRNELKRNATYMRSMKFEPDIDDEQVTKIFNEQKQLDKKFDFYDKFIKAREEVKNEIKPNNMGERKQV